jgi:hypothetical protein
MTESDPGHLLHQQKRVSCLVQKEDRKLMECQTTKSYSSLYRPLHLSIPRHALLWHLYHAVSPLSGLLGKFGLSTDMFKFEQQEGGGYGVKFER